MGRLIWIYWASHVCSSFIVHGYRFLFFFLIFSLLVLLSTHPNWDFTWELHVSYRHCLGLKR
ncbi:hypothetical protein BJX68DRAFT_109700 [Aspergillus pseudodeflectus]|uniref:Uncharacterized protein n=1 Tax=Aspergillus pseudodeflectus TaxID=176178 RepID=A0ABR4K5U2_9EURO